MAACSNWPSAKAGLARQHCCTVISYDDDDDDDDDHVHNV